MDSEIESKAAARKVYIGDGVYAEWDGYNIILTAENGLSTTEMIYLDPDTFCRLCLYAGNWHTALGHKKKKEFAKDPEEV